MRAPNILVTLISLCLFSLAVISVFSQYTDADLFDQDSVRENVISATTLDFSALDTANETSKKLFFSVSGLLPGGFHTESIRVKNAGQLGFPFTIVAAQTSGNESLCQNLEVRVLQDWKTIYSGSLLSLAYSGELKATSDTEDLVFVVSLSNKDVNLKNQVCSFAFAISSALPSKNFSDTEVLDNTISTGTWSEE